MLKDKPRDSDGNIYNITTPQELLEFLKKTMKYGFVSDGKIYNHPLIDGVMEKHYKLRLGEDLIQSKYGICWDFTEFERTYFENFGMEHECYYVQGFKENSKTTPTHTFLIYKDENKWKWFEYSWRKMRGIHEYETKEDALVDITTKHLKYHKCIENKYRLYKYTKVKKNLTAVEFIKHCVNNGKIRIL